MSFSLTAHNVRSAVCEITGVKCLCADIQIDGPFPVAKTIDIRRLPEVIKSAAGMAQLAATASPAASSSPAVKRDPADS